MCVRECCEFVHCVPWITRVCVYAFVCLNISHSIDKRLHNLRDIFFVSVGSRKLVRCDRDRCHSIQFNAIGREPFQLLWIRINERCHYFWIPSAMVADKYAIFVWFHFVYEFSWADMGMLQDNKSILEDSHWNQNSEPILRENKKMQIGSMKYLSFAYWIHRRFQAHTLDMLIVTIPFVDLIHLISYGNCCSVYPLHIIEFDSSNAPYDPREFCRKNHLHLNI